MWAADSTVTHCTHTAPHCNTHAHHDGHAEALLFVQLANTIHHAPAFQASVARFEWVGGWPWAGGAGRSSSSTGGGGAGGAAQPVVLVRAVRQIEARHIHASHLRSEWDQAAGTMGFVQSHRAACLPTHPPHLEEARLPSLLPPPRAPPCSWHCPAYCPLYCPSPHVPPELPGSFHRRRQGQWWQSAWCGGLSGDLRAARQRRRRHGGAGDRFGVHTAACNRDPRCMPPWLLQCRGATRLVRNNHLAATARRAWVLRRQISPPSHDQHVGE